jgi:hypothetical protein
MIIMSNDYEFAVIMDKYNQVKKIAEENIGLDTHTKKFTKDVKSIDLKVIDQEYKRMHDAGSDLAKICPHGNFWLDLKNMLTIPNYRKTVLSICKYAETIKPELVKTHMGNIPWPNAPEVVDNLYNAFNQGLVKTYQNSK